MIDGILAKRNASTKACITVKTLISLVVIAMAVALPQILHVATGAAGGVKWLPMYLPVIIGACVLGAKWGVAAAVLSPITSFLLTSAVSSPMPAAARLPFMAAELAVMALVAGSFSSLIVKNAAWSIACNRRCARNRQSVLPASRRNFPKRNALYSCCHLGTDSNRYSRTYRKSRNRSDFRVPVLAGA